MTIKELLAKDKDLFDSANAVVKTEWFSRYLALCKAQFMESPSIQDPVNSQASAMLRGAREFGDVILTMTDMPEDPKNLSGTGLIYDIPGYIAKEKEQEKKD